MSVPIVTNVTYSELVDLINSNSLDVGLQYSLSFNTRHYILDYNGATLLDPVDGITPVTNTGELEHLILTASSSNTFDMIVKSVEYPQDVIHYDWNPDRWLNDVAFSIDQTNIIDGFKGVIYYREDTVQNNSIGEDFRNVKYRRWKRNDTVWSSDVTFSRGMLCRVPSVGIYLSLADDNLNNEISDSSKWVKILSLSYTEYWCCDSSKALDVTDFIDCNIFEESTGGTYDVCVKNNIFPSFRDTIDQFIGFTGSLLNNNVFFLKNEGIYNVYGNSFGVLCGCNTFYGEVSLNNIYSQMSVNCIDSSFIGNSLSDLFSKNIIGSGFSGNTVGSNLYQNIIAPGCGNNVFYPNCTENKIKSGFQKNIGLFNSVDFLSSTHVYNDYSCSILKTSTGTFKLKYIDGLDNTEKIVNANA